MTKPQDRTTSDASRLIEEMIMGFIRYDNDVDLKSADVTAHYTMFRVHIGFIIKNPLEHNWDNAVTRGVSLLLPSLRESDIFKCAERAAQISRTEMPQRMGE